MLLRHWAKSSLIKPSKKNVRQFQKLYKTKKHPDGAYLLERQFYAFYTAQGRPHLLSAKTPRSMWWREERES